MDEMKEGALLVMALAGILGGPLSNLIVELLKRLGLSGAPMVRSLSLLICSCVSSALLATQGVLDWRTAIGAAVIAFAMAEGQYRAAKSTVDTEAEQK